MFVIKVIFEQKSFFFFACYISHDFRFLHFKIGAQTTTTICNIKWNTDHSNKHKANSSKLWKTIQFPALNFVFYRVWKKRYSRKYIESVIWNDFIAKIFVFQVKVRTMIPIRKILELLSYLYACWKHHIFVFFMKSIYRNLRTSCVACYYMNLKKIYILKWKFEMLLQCQKNINLWASENIWNITLTIFHSALHEFFFA